MKEGWEDFLAKASHQAELDFLSFLQQSSLSMELLACHRPSRRHVAVEVFLDHQDNPSRLKGADARSRYPQQPAA